MSIFGRELLVDFDSNNISEKEKVFNEKTKRYN
jgi:hypothetical protein